MREQPPYEGQGQQYPPQPPGGPPQSAGANFPPSQAPGQYGYPPQQPPYQGGPPKRKLWPIFLSIALGVLVLLGVTGFIISRGQDEYRDRVNVLCEETRSNLTGILEQTQDEAEVFAAASPMIQDFGDQLAEVEPATTDEDAANEYLAAIQALPAKLDAVTAKLREGTADAALVEIQDFATTLITAAEAAQDLGLDPVCGEMNGEEAEVVGLTGSLS